MDALAFRLGNRLLGNPDDAAALELTVTGPTRKFGCDALLALTGADMRAELGAPLIVIEAMKMEIAVQAEQAGTVVELRCRQGQPVAAGETLLILRTEGQPP
jgi:urea carboxylase